MLESFYLRSEGLLSSSRLLVSTPTHVAGKLLTSPCVRWCQWVCVKWQHARGIACQCACVRVEL